MDEQNLELNNIMILVLSRYGVKGVVGDLYFMLGIK